MTCPSSDAHPLASLPLSPPLPLPRGQTHESITRLFASVDLEGAPKQEINNYWQQDWKRFVYTYGLVAAANLIGSCLELGANPYFTTLLLKYFTDLHLTLANYFGPQFAAQAQQQLTVIDPHTGAPDTHVMEFSHFNIEDSAFPFVAASFDVILVCEVIEHLQSDPVKVLLQIKRILKPGGHLILTTPNVSRLENVCRMAAGVNIYDPYSGYGPYGRHNREYNKHELALLLAYCGFDIDVLSTADVHDNVSSSFFPVEQIIPLVRPREHDLGQYLFCRCRNSRPARTKRPAWLYRSYPAGELES
jgi:SAM-dependent methyltransferase